MPDLRALLTTPKHQVRALILGVFATLLCLLPSVANYHGDEALYTDASIRMVQTGDYWTPHFGDGRVRLLKPVLAYWTIVASYKALGISLASSRLPFLVAGCLIIYLTWRLSLTLFRRPAEAALAALIAGSNVQVLTVSIRSTPDVLLSLFVLLSLLGFARIIFGEDRSWSSYALAYVGAGLAVQTKGLPGIAPVAFAFAHCLLFARRRANLRALLEWKAIALGAAIASCWYVVTLALHGREALESFLADQVSGRVVIGPWIQLKNLAVYLGAALRHFLPWTLFVAAGLAWNRRGAVEALRRQREETVFLAGWFLFMVAIFTFGNMNRTRYLVPTYPLLAAFSAGVLMRSGESPRFATFARIVVKVLAKGMLAIGLLIAGAGLLIHVRMALAGVAMTLVTVWVLAAARRREAWHPWPAVAVLTLLVFATAELGLRPVFTRSPGAAIAAQLLAADGPGQTAQALNVPAAYQAQVRVFSGGRIRVVPVDLPADEEIADLPGPVIVGEADRTRLEDRGWVMKPAGFANRHWPPEDLLQLLRAETRAAAYARNLIPYYVALPPGPTR